MIFWHNLTILYPATENTSFWHAEASHNGREWFLRPKGWWQPGQDWPGSDMHNQLPKALQPMLLKGAGPRPPFWLEAVFSPFQFLFGLIYSSTWKLKPVSLRLLPHQKWSPGLSTHKTRWLYSGVDYQLPRKYPFGAEIRLRGFFSLRQCGRGLSPILAIFWKKQPPSLATSLCSFRSWAPSTYDSLVAEQVTHPHISTNPKPRDTVETSSVFLPKTWKSQKSFLSIFTLFTYMSKSEILPAFHRFSQGTTDTKRMQFALAWVKLWGGQRNNSSPGSQRRSTQMRSTQSRASVYSHSHSSEMSTCQRPQNRLVVVPYFKN